MNMLELLFSLIVVCPPVNAEYINSEEECIFLCINGVVQECVTGPYDDIVSLPISSICVDVEKLF